MTGWRPLVASAAIILAAGSLQACEHVEEPWITNQAEWKMEKFETQSDDVELRHRLRHGQEDR